MQALKKYMDKEFMKGVFGKKTSFFVWKQGLFYVMIKRPLLRNGKRTIQKKIKAGIGSEEKDNNHNIFTGCMRTRMDAGIQAQAKEPVIVVIDPGHGGEENQGRGSASSLCGEKSDAPGGSRP